MKKCNAVFEGGGVRGIGHVGAVCRMEQAGWQFVDLAGSSAGAIVAALLAAGYSGRELKKELETLDYMRFKGKDLPDYFGMLGKSVSLLMSLGVYHTDYLEDWMDELLNRKGMRRFGDIKGGGRRLKITASDLTDRRLLVLPDDLGEFAEAPDDFCIAPAVRMSVSIPIFFEPVRWKDRQGREHLIVDGGLLSNYPIWLLDDGKHMPYCPTFGFKFVDGDTACRSQGRQSDAVCQSQGGQPGVVSRNCRSDEACQNQSFRPDINLPDYLKAIVSTCLDAMDNSHLLEGDYERTIRIPATVETKEGRRRISAVDFDISREDSRILFDNGWSAAERFLKNWNFDKWKRKYR